MSDEPTPTPAPAPSSWEPSRAAKIASGFFGTIFFTGTIIYLIRHGESANLIHQASISNSYWGLMAILGGVGLGGVIRDLAVFFGKK